MGRVAEIGARHMFIAAAVLSGLLALVFGAGALGKLTRLRSQVETAAKLRIDWRRYRLIAVPEAAAAAGLLGGLGIAPLGVAAAAGLIVLMAGAVAFRLRVHDALSFVLGDTMLVVLAGITMALRLGSA
jgi:hypothetical protein